MAPRVLATRGAVLHRLPEITDLNGSLSFAEIGKGLPFVPQRYFLVYGVPTKDVRGQHAHHTLHEFLVCVRGSCAVVVDDGSLREEVTLDSPTIGLHKEPKVWISHYKYSPDAILLVLASKPYDAADYIRDYDEFLASVGVTEGAGR